MLSTRFITALILGSVFIVAIYYLPSNIFQLLLALLILLSAFEWAKLAQFNKPYLFVLLLFILLSLVVFTSPINLFIIAAISLLFWLVNLIFIIAYPRLKQVLSKAWAKVLNGFLLLAPLFILGTYLQATNPKMLILLLFIVSATDIGAYFIGKNFGKRKLIASVSPNKTIEGVFGGLLLAFLVFVVWAFISKTPLQIMHYLMLLLLVLATIVGDLYISIYKRSAKLKDSGDILPGHGGILDRIDGYTAAVPIYAFMLLI